jgi:5'(3')-deoxyribonucleotidase
MKIKEILLIDMDDVLADFTTAKLKAIENVPIIGIPWCQYKFFENLEPMKDAIESVKILSEHYDICILTRPSVMNPLSYTEKRVWVEKYFGYNMCVNLILCYDKTMVQGDYLIDDNLHVGRFNPSWKHIHFGQNNFLDWLMVTDFLMNKIK